MTELPVNCYHKLSEYLEEVNFNHLFARAVIDHTVTGRVYVDDVNYPKTFYIVHRYGMSLIGGDSSNTEFNKAFRDYALNINRSRTDFEWMQVFPYSWNATLKDLFGEKLVNARDNKTDSNPRSIVELNTRVNFVFKKEPFLQSFRESIDDNAKIKIVESTNWIYDQMAGSVVPKSFWNTSKDFTDKGVSFSLYYEEKIASTAFSSFLAPGKLELGIETLPEFRGLGLAEKVCAALINYCLEKNLEPIWACRRENTGSYMLAKKLGFVPVLELPYYRLSN